jgi:hypothetical protein
VSSDQQQRRPDRIFFIVGAPRCGTTALSSALRDHPGIDFAVPKEPHYFSRLRHDWSVDQVSRDYLSIFFRRWRDGDATLGEGSPSYIYSDEAIDAIEHSFPEARYIVMVRNPMEMLPSYHQRLVYLLDETETDLATAWRLQDQRLQGAGIPRRCRNPHMLRYRDICRVGTRIDALMAKVGQERVKLVLYDDFARAPVETYREILSFLALPDDGRVRLPRRNRTRVPKRVMLHLLMVQPRSEVLRLALSRLRHMSRKSPLIRAILRTIRRSSSTVSTRPTIPPDLWAECAEDFRSDVRRLSEIFGRNLEHWLEPRHAGREPALPIAAQAPLLVAPAD